MKNTIIDPIPLGSRWELFVDMDEMDKYIDGVIAHPLVSINNGEFGALIGKINPYIFSMLIFRNARLTSAFPFFLSRDCLVDIEITQIAASSAGEAFITLDTGIGKITANGADYAIHQNGYRKKCRLYLTAIAYSFSRIDLIGEIKRELTVVQGFQNDEYTLLGKIVKSEHPVYSAALPLTGIQSLPVYAKSIYLKAPQPEETGAGDIWLTCFTPDFAEVLLNA